MTMDSHVVKPSLCPQCGCKLDMATHPMKDDGTGVVGTGAPDPGDFSMCLDCGTPLRFDDSMVLRKATADDLRLLEPAQLKLMFAMQTVRNLVVPPGGFMRNEKRH